AAAVAARPVRTAPASPTRRGWRAGRRGGVGEGAAAVRTPAAAASADPSARCRPSHLPVSPAPARQKGLRVVRRAATRPSRRTIGVSVLAGDIPAAGGREACRRLLAAQLACHVLEVLFWAA